MYKKTIRMYKKTIEIWQRFSRLTTISLFVPALTLFSGFVLTLRWTSAEERGIGLTSMKFLSARAGAV